MDMLARSPTGPAPTASAGTRWATACRSRPRPSSGFVGLVTADAPDVDAHLASGAAGRRLVQPGPGPLELWLALRLRLVRGPYSSSSSS